MATTASNVILAPVLYDDAVIRVSASGVSVYTRGDWMIASGTYAFAGTTAFIASPAYKVSGLGIALDNNPTYNSQGVASTTSGFSVATRFVARVTAGNSGSARTIPIGSHAFPGMTGSGIVGQTGATGVNTLWITAPPQGISANPTGAIASGVAQVINHPVGGDSGVGQIDIRVVLATNVGYF